MDARWVSGQTPAFTIQRDHPGNPPSIWAPHQILGATAAYTFVQGALYWIFYLIIKLNLKSNVYKTIAYD